MSVTAAAGSDEHIPGWEGSVGPFKSEYGMPHVYARDIYSGAGNCVCGRHLGHSKHVQAAPGVPIPDRLRP
jgi:hypothetical protein